MYADFYGHSGFPSAATIESIAVAILGVLLVIYLLLIACSVLMYVMGSLGMYTISKRRGIHHPWLAWIPIANMWILGSISDQYQYVSMGKIRNRRKVLLGLTIATYALSLFVGFTIGLSAAMGVFGAANGMVATVLLMLIGYLAVIAVAITLAVFLFMAYYDLFASCKPDNAVLFLILGVFFTFLLPFFVFACRKKDLGMPPRKQSAPVQPQWQEQEIQPELSQPIMGEATTGQDFAEEEDFADTTEEPTEE